MTKEQFVEKFLEIREDFYSHFGAEYLNDIAKELEEKSDTYILAFNACLKEGNTLEEVYNTAEVFRFDDSDYELLLKYMIVLNIAGQIHEVENKEQK